MSTQQGKDKDRDLLAKIKEKGDDDYEKNITYISAGTLVLSLTFIEKIVNLGDSNSVVILIISWILLALTLLANLISHQLSSYYHEKTICDFDADDPNLEKNINKRNKVIRTINWGTTFSLVVGILFLILFCSINAIKMSNEKKALDNSGNANYEKKGRTIIVPSTSASSTSSTGGNSGSSNSSQQESSNNQGSTNSSDSIKK